MTPDATYAYDYMQSVALSEQDFPERAGHEPINRRASRRNLLILSLIYFALLAYLIF